jgi:hypothetical protein
LVINLQCVKVYPKGKTALSLTRTLLHERYSTGSLEYSSPFYGVCLIVF